MTEKNHDNKESDDRKEIKEAVESLTDIEITYGIASELYHGYDMGGHSVGRSERSYLLDLFFRLNTENNSLIQSINPFKNNDLFLDEAKKRIKNLDLEKTRRLSFGSDDKKDFSLMILRLWIIHYRDKIEKNDKIESISERDYSFEREIKKAEMIYALYLSEVNIDEDVLDIESKKYLDNDKEGIMKYRIQLGWKVNDLCPTQDLFLEDSDDQEGLR